MEVPESIRIGLANIDEGLFCRWNPLSKVVGGHSFDVNGNARKLVHDPRWELWHKPLQGEPYKITTLEGPGGVYAPLGEWVVEFMQLINPANYDGDMHKMINALVDDENETVKKLDERTYNDLSDYLADLTWSEVSRGSRVTTLTKL